MPFADYTDGINIVKAIRWDGLDETADEAVYQIPGISVHTDTVNGTTIKELRFNTFLTIPEGDWLVVSVLPTSVSASHITNANFEANYVVS